MSRSGGQGEGSIVLRKRELIRHTVRHGLYGHIAVVGSEVVERGVHLLKLALIVGTGVGSGNGRGIGQAVGTHIHHAVLGQHHVFTNVHGDAVRRKIGSWRNQHTEEAPLQDVGLQIAPRALGVKAENAAFGKVTADVALVEMGNPILHGIAADVEPKVALAVTSTITRRHTEVKQVVGVHALGSEGEQSVEGHFLARQHHSLATEIFCHGGRNVAYRRIDMGIISAVVGGYGDRGFAAMV